jgi:hypothetical protein
MKKAKFISVTLALALICSTAHSQVGRRLGDAAGRAAERAATKQTERRTEDAVNKAIDNTLDGNKNQQKQQQDKASENSGSENQQKQQQSPPSNAESTNTAPSPAADNTPAKRFSDTPDNSGKKYPFKHGSYVQITKAMGMEIKHTVYFDNWGDWSATENKSEMRMLGRTIKTDKIEIVKGNLHWDIDLIERTGTHYQAIELPEEAMEPVAAAMAGQIQEGTEIEELGEERYLGYICKKVRIKNKDMNMDVTSLNYGNLPMKMEGKVMGMEVYNVITELSESAPPKSKFEVPAGIKIETIQ